MTPTPLDPMPEDVQTLLESVRGREGSPLAAKAAVRSRLNQTLSLGWEHPAAPIAKPSAAPRLSWTAGTAGRVFLAAAGVVGVGGLIWATGRTSARFTESSARTPIPMVTPAAPGRAAPQAAPGAVPTQPEAVAPVLGEPAAGGSQAVVPAAKAADRVRVVRRAISGPNPPAPVAGSEAAGIAGLVGEQRLLDQARDALRDGDTSRALAAVGEHARRYPDGQLAEEREVLGIQAMVRSGSYAEARSRGQAFLTNYPDSPLHRVVQATVDSIP